MKKSKFVDKLEDLLEENLERMGCAADYTHSYEKKNGSPILVLEFPDGSVKNYDVTELYNRHEAEEASIPSLYEEFKINILADIMAFGQNVEEESYNEFNNHYREDEEDEYEYDEDEEEDYSFDDYEDEEELPQREHAENTEDAPYLPLTRIYDEIRECMEKEGFHITPFARGKSPFNLYTLVYRDSDNYVPRIRLGNIEHDYSCGYVGPREITDRIISAYERAIQMLSQMVNQNPQRQTAPAPVRQEQEEPLEDLEIECEIE